MPRSSYKHKYKGKPHENAVSEASSRNRSTRKVKFSSELCDNKMTFQECEMAILRHAVDEMDTKRGEKTANSPDVIKMIRIVEEFLMDKKLVCYGGTAINNILPKHAQFYNKNVEIPDYDFFSPTALEHAKELANIFFKHGYDEVEAKTGVHAGTYKVFVNFIPVADITFLHPTLYTALKRDSINIAGIRYAPANYLRMGMFLELSRPDGDVSRWEKVLKRLNLLNQYHPLHTNSKCTGVEFHHKSSEHKNIPEKIYLATRDSLIDQGVVFFGGFAASMYDRYMVSQTKYKRVPDFDVLAENPERCAKILKETLQENKIRGIKLIQHTAIGEVVPEHIEVVAEHKTIAYIYKTISCHSYNTINIDKKEVNIATIDTMLSFYLAFLYADKPYYDKTRILCMSAYLFQVEQHNRLSQKGVLKRFSTKCYGKQETLEDMRSKKNQLFNELSKNRKSTEYEKAFLKYEPKTNSKLKEERDADDKRHSLKPAEKTYIIEDEPEDDHITKTIVEKDKSASRKEVSPKPTPIVSTTDTKKRRPRKIRYKSYRVNSKLEDTPQRNNKKKEKKEKEHIDKDETDQEPEPSIPKSKSWMSRFKTEGNSKGNFLV
jgi:hypothetical protein